MGGKGSGRKPKMVDGKPDRSTFGQPVNSYLNTNQIGLSKALMELPPVDWSDAESLRSRYFEYLELTEKFKLRPLVTGVALAFNVDRATLYHLHSRSLARYKGMTQECYEVIDMIYRQLEMIAESSLLEEKGNPVKHIFSLKNHFGYKDQTESVIRREDDGRRLPSMEEIDKKLAGMKGNYLPEAEESEDEEIEAEYEEIE